MKCVTYGVGPRKFGRIDKVREGVGGGVTDLPPLLNSGHIPSSSEFRYNRTKQDGSEVEEQNFFRENRQFQLEFIDLDFSLIY